MLWYSLPTCSTLVYSHLYPLDCKYVVFFYFLNLLIYSNLHNIIIFYNFIYYVYTIYSMLILWVTTLSIIYSSYKSPTTCSKSSESWTTVAMFMVLVHIHNSYLIFYIVMLLSFSFPLHELLLVLIFRFHLSYYFS